jgi:protein-S-isoprenylcysteine O-methyltransferase Ste14
MLPVKATSSKDLVVDKMPAAVSGRKPPAKNCPLCQVKIWDLDTTRNLHEAWRLYREHIHTIHPAYESWERKTSMLYYIVATIFVLGLFAVVFVPDDLSLIVFALAVGALVIGTPIVVLIRWTGKRRFRDSWKREHAGAVTPVGGPVGVSSGTEKVTDRWFQLGGPLLILAVLVVSYLSTAVLISTLWIPGGVLLVVGLSLNAVSRAYLGKFYLEAVRIGSDHELITDGPYRFTRHPVYLSVLFFAFCPPLILGSVYGFVVALAIIPMVLHRISVEEKFLVSRFGEEYLEYSHRTKRLIPYVY